MTKNKGGRPVKHKTPEGMQVIIDQFFVDCVTNKLHPTVTGLALALDLTRKGLIDYENKDNPEFCNTVKKAKLRVEAHIEQRLFHNNATGCIFNLKNNFDWVDKINTENQSLGADGKPIDPPKEIPIQLIAVQNATNTDT